MEWPQPFYPRPLYPMGSALGPTDFMNSHCMKTGVILYTKQELNSHLQYWNDWSTVNSSLFRIKASRIPSQSRKIWKKISIFYEDVPKNLQYAYVYLAWGSPPRKPWAELPQNYRTGEMNLWSCCITHIQNLSSVNLHHCLGRLQQNN